MRSPWGFAAGTQALAQIDPLPSWTGGPAKQAIIKFVQTTTDPSSAKFVRPAERIATFDQDDLPKTDNRHALALLTSYAFLGEKGMESLAHSRFFLREEPLKAISFLQQQLHEEGSAFAASL